MYNLKSMLVSSLLGVAMIVTPAFAEWTHEDLSSAVTAFENTADDTADLKTAIVCTGENDKATVLVLTRNESNAGIARSCGAVKDDDVTYSVTLTTKKYGTQNTCMVQKRFNNDRIDGGPSEYQGFDMKLSVNWMTAPVKEGRRGTMTHNGLGLIDVPVRCLKK